MSLSFLKFWKNRKTKYDDLVDQTRHSIERPVQPLYKPDRNYYPEPPPPPPGTKRHHKANDFDPKKIGIEPVPSVPRDTYVPIRQDGTRVKKPRRTA